MAHIHDPEYRFRPEGGNPGLPMRGISYQQALDKASELAKTLRKRVYVEVVNTIGSADPK